MGRGSPPTPWRGFSAPRLQISLGVCRPSGGATPPGLSRSLWSLMISVVTLAPVSGLCRDPWRGACGGTEAAWKPLPWVQALPVELINPGIRSTP